jgi:hypothetical protein
VVVEHLVLGDAEPPRRLLRFEVPTLGQHAAAHLVVARIAIGHRDKLHRVPRLGELVGRAAELDIAVVRMGPERNDAEFLLLGRDQTRREQRDKRQVFHGPKIITATALVTGGWESPEVCRIPFPQPHHLADSAPQCRPNAPSA